MGQQNRSKGDADHGLDNYVRQVQRHALLSRAQELSLANRWRQQGDAAAARQLVEANLRFVVKVVHDYRGYGLGALDLVQEGNMGLMMAVRKFEPERGFRLVSYAVWWIRAYIQNYVMRTWSQVKLGTTQAQRKLFFKLRSTREQLDRQSATGQQAAAADIAIVLGVREQDVREMEVRMGGRDLSLDAPVQTDSGHVAHVDVLVDPDSARDLQQLQLARRQCQRLVRAQVDQVMKTLNDKERYIVSRRLMTDGPETLQQIGEHFRISRERARQIEGNVRRKMRLVLQRAGLSEAAAA